MENNVTFKDIQEANKSIGTTNIQGKEYAEVNQRIKAFRICYPTGGIYTELLSNQNGVAIFKATVSDEAGKVLGTGTAYEKEGNSFINKTSYIENCETSAVGRALGMCGFGIDTSLCSAEELQNAKLNQKDSSKATEKNDQKTTPAKSVKASENSATAVNNNLPQLSDTDKADLLDYLSGVGVPFDFKTEPELDTKLALVSELMKYNTNFSALITFCRHTTLNEMTVAELNKALNTKKAGK